MQPVVSIIVNCYNQGKFLKRCVQSVLNQSFRNLECIIVDDGSTDDTPTIAAQLAETDTRIRYLRKPNGGLPQARNFGVRAAKGTWIQCLDADDWIHPDKTAVQLQAIEQDPDQEAVLYCDYERVTMNQLDQPVAHHPQTIGSYTQAGLLQRLMLPDFIAKTPHPSLQQCMLIHRRIFDKYKFPEQLKALGDRYFALELVASQVPFVYTPFTGTYYSKHQNNRTNNWKYMQGYYVLFYEMVKSHYPHLLSFGKPGIEHLLEDTMKKKDREGFQHLLGLVQYPVKVLDHKIQAGNRQVLQLLYQLRQWTPGMFWYPQFRGPKVKKVLSLLGSKHENVYQ